MYLDFKLSQLLVIIGFLGNTIDAYYEQYIPNELVEKIFSRGKNVLCINVENVIMQNEKISPEVLYDKRFKDTIVKDKSYEQYSLKTKKAIINLALANAHAKLKEIKSNVRFIDLSNNEKRLELYRDINEICQTFLLRPNNTERSDVGLPKQIEELEKRGLFREVANVLQFNKSFSLPAIKQEKSSKSKTIDIIFIFGGYEERIKDRIYTFYQTFKKSKDILPDYVVLLGGARDLNSVDRDPVLNDLRSSKSNYSKIKELEEEPFNEFDIMHYYYLEKMKDIFKELNLASVSKPIVTNLDTNKIFSNNRLKESFPRKRNDFILTYTPKEQNTQLYEFTSQQDVIQPIAQKINEKTNQEVNQNIDKKKHVEALQKVEQDLKLNPGAMSKNNFNFSYKFSNGDRGIRSAKGTAHSNEIRKSNTTKVCIVNAAKILNNGKFDRPNTLTTIEAFIAYLLKENVLDLKNDHNTKLNIYSISKAPHIIYQADITKQVLLSILSEDKFNIYPIGLSTDKFNPMDFADTLARCFYTRCQILSQQLSIENSIKKRLNHK